MRIYLSNIDLLPSESIASRQIIEKTPDHKLRLFLAEIVTALEDIHRAGILHGDLGHHNILIDYDGHIVVIDYGISIFTDINERKRDWVWFSLTLYHQFRRSMNDLKKDSLKKFLRHMTDEHIAGKSHFILPLLNSWTFCNRKISVN